MKGFEIVSVALVGLFVLGIAVGILLVIALPLLRGLAWQRRQRRYLSHGGWPRVTTRADDQDPPWYERR